MAQNKKDVKVMAAGLPFLVAGAIWFVLAMVLPIYKVSMIIAATVVSVVVMAVMLSVRSKQVAALPPVPTVKKRAEEMAIKIDECRKQLLELSAQINDGSVAGRVNNIAALMDKIADDVEKDPKDRNKVRKLANHYGAMIVDLVKKYIVLEGQGEGGENISSAIDEIKKGLETIETAVKSLLDDLFSDDAMEVSADIAVLEQLFKTEGTQNRMNFESLEL